MMKKTNFILLLLFLLCLLPSSVQALTGEEPLVRINGEKLYLKSFDHRLQRYHTVPDIADKMERPMASVDYEAILQEMIDEKLLVQESLRAGLDKMTVFREAIAFIELNLSLRELRKEEVQKGITLSEEEIIVRHKQIHEKRGKNSPLSPLSYKERQRIKRELRKEKERVREKDFFRDLRKKAHITYPGTRKIRDHTHHLPTHALALVNGEAITQKEVDALRQLRRGAKKPHPLTPGEKERLLQTLINRKLLDQEALSRSYLGRKSLALHLSREREALLIKLLDRQILNKGVTVSEEEIKKHYSEEKESFRTPPKVLLRLLALNSIEKAHALRKELDDGADFQLLIKENSEPSQKKQSDNRRWVALSALPQPMKKALASMKTGELAGPIPLSGKHLIFRLEGKEEGKEPPYGELRESITLLLRNRKIQKVRHRALVKLRSAASIEIDNDLLKKFMDKRRSPDWKLNPNE